MYRDDEEQSSDSQFVYNHCGWRGAKNFKRERLVVQRNWIVTMNKEASRTSGKQSALSTVEDLTNEAVEQNNFSFQSSKQRKTSRSIHIIFNNRLMTTQLILDLPHIYFGC